MRNLLISVDIDIISRATEELAIIFQLVDARRSHNRQLQQSRYVVRDWRSSLEGKFNNSNAI